MITTTWTSAPAGDSGTGLLAARPADCAAARLRALPIVEVFGIAPTRVRLDATSVPAAEQFGAVHQSNPQNDVPTLGIHSPGRPLS
ncbi:hypothetical protein GCU56_05380 [Geodermatophilus sabuli]|uniref:Uncharacterized protein n=1 Tax=Geodermatophilus sabuli TaxID=1564158 RepID=A0A7K3VXC2_9ACTN|nr:hypothetical protein [Geodermatophilus sabuli]NEK57305.1 hypothetical protein [Geodermatophilus sabuli]